MGSKIKIIDYNIRYTDDGENRMIADRAPRLEALIRKYEPDVIGLQEASRRWVDFLDDHLYDAYKMRYIYRSEKNIEATPILWKRDKFDLVKEGHFWLSDMPEMSTKSFGSKHYRICNYVLLRLKETGETFYYVNTHMSGGEASARSAELILKRMEEREAFSKYGLLLNGDFNVTPESRCGKIFNESGKVRDLNLDLGNNEASTVNGYDPDPNPNGRIIDYIYYTPAFMKPLTYRVLHEEILGGYISDHRGLYAEVELKEQEQ